MEEGFPPGLARMACLQYQAPRFIRVAGAAAEAGCVTRGMVAGCGMAVALLQSYLGPLARSIREQEGERGTTVRTYVDDLTLAKTGTAQEVADALVAAYRIAKEGLGKIGQQLKTTNTVILAVGPEAQNNVKATFKKAFNESLDVSFSARDLGVDATLGGPKRIKVLRDRVSKIGGRATRIMSLPVGAYKRARLVGGLLIAGGMYGAELTNVPGHLKKKVRTAVARAIPGKALNPRRCLAGVLLAVPGRPLEPEVAVPADRVHGPALLLT